jgi:hypothetical protein
MHFQLEADISAGVEPFHAHLSNWLLTVSIVCQYAHISDSSKNQACGAIWIAPNSPDHR